MNTTSSDKELIWSSDGTVVWQTKTGSLVCSCHDFDEGGSWWCSHLSGIIKTAKDADSIQSRPVVVVPLFSTLLNASAEVTLGEEKQGMTPVYLRSSDPALEGWFLGFIDRNEGRLVIRTMLIEFLRAQYPTIPACDGPYHAGPLFTESDPGLSDTTNPRVLANILCLFTGGTCYDCLNDDESLSPDIGSNWPSS